MTDIDLSDLLAVLAERQYAALPYRIVPVDPAVDHGLGADRA